MSLFRLGQVAAVEEKREAELEKLTAMDESARKVYAARQHIVGQILTLRCPRPNCKRRLLCSQMPPERMRLLRVVPERLQGEFARAGKRVSEPSGAEEYFGTLRASLAVGQRLDQILFGFIDTNLPNSDQGFTPDTSAKTKNVQSTLVQNQTSL